VNWQLYNLHYIVVASHYRTHDIPLNIMNR